MMFVKKLFMVLFMLLALSGVASAETMADKVKSSVDVATGESATAKQIIKDDSSTAIIFGLPSFDNAYLDDLKKAFGEIKIDTTKLK